MRITGWGGGPLLVLFALTAAILLPPDANAQQAPSPIVERTLEVTGRKVRMTLFDNRVAVVSVHQGSVRVLLRQQLLDQDEYAGYLAALQRDADELAEARRHHGARGNGGNGLILLYLGPDAPVQVRYSSVTVLDLVTARLAATLDDVESRVIWGPERIPELASWRPKRGDRVELHNGTGATVREVREDGTLVLEHDGTGIHELVPVDARSNVILRVDPETR